MKSLETMFVKAAFLLAKSDDGFSNPNSKGRIGLVGGMRRKELAAWTANETAGATEGTKPVAETARRPKPAIERASGLGQADESRKHIHRDQERTGAGRS